MTKTKRSPKSPATKVAGSTIRIAALINPKTKRKVLERVTKNGELSRRARELLGIKRVKEFVVIQATSWAAATKQVRAGKGTRASAA